MRKYLVFAFWLYGVLCGCAQELSYEQMKDSLEWASERLKFDPGNDNLRLVEYRTGCGMTPIISLLFSTGLLLT